MQVELEFDFNKHPLSQRFAALLVEASHVERTIKPNSLSYDTLISHWAPGNIYFSIAKWLKDGDHMVVDVTNTKWETAALVATMAGRIPAFLILDDNPVGIKNKKLFIPDPTLKCMVDSDITTTISNLDTLNRKASRGRDSMDYISPENFFVAAYALSCVGSKDFSKKFYNKKNLSALQVMVARCDTSW